MQCHPRRCVAAVLSAIAIAGLVVAAAPTVSGASAAASTSSPKLEQVGFARKFCAYSSESVADLDSFQKLVGHSVNCAVVFNHNAVNWQQWDTPWFTVASNPDLDWADWAKQYRSRRLIITQDLAPASNIPSNWLSLAASGAYKGYATALARNLIKAGLGNSVIRLANEANGDWYADQVPMDAAGQANWRRAWANVVTAMRAVSGAHFLFDWCVNYTVWRHNVPLANFYPGNAYVDIVGLDAYDENTTSTTGRYEYQYSRAGGIQDVYNFAMAHGKPLSFPEWGLLQLGGPQVGGGPDPEYLDGIGQFVSSHNVAYTGYWYAQDTQNLLTDPDSLSSLQQYFGASGLALGS